MPQLYQRKGGEILVNTETGGAQLAQSIAALPGGGFVVVWSDTSGVGGDTPDSGIKGQRFDANGNKVGGEFLINTAIDGFQGQSEVAALDNGRFVVTWSSEIGPEGDDPGSGIKGQVFNADGTKSGGEFFVNTSMPDLQLQSAITALASGNFVVSWLDLSGLGGDPDGGIKMQIFDSTGARVGGELLANTVTAGAQNAPALTALASGGFAAVWTGAAKVSFQLFNAAGAKIGSELQVNTLSGGVAPDIAVLGTGFIVTWAHRDNAQDPDGYDVFAQLLDANGAKIGGEFQANTATAGNQTVTHVTALPDGSFLITWQGPDATGAGFDVHGQVFTAAGVKVGVEFVINGVTADTQTVPEIAVLSSGDIVATWTDASGVGGDASGTGVKMQILTLAGAPTDIALSNATVSETVVANTPVATLSATGAINSNFTYTIVSDSTGGAFALDGDTLIVVDNRLLDFETQPSLNVRIRVTDLNGNSYEETMTLSVADAAIEARWSASDTFPVNTDTFGFNTPAAMTALSSGGFVVISAWFQIGFGNGFRGQIFDAAGAKVGAEFDLDITDRAGAVLAVAPLPSGGFMLVFESIDSSGGGSFPIRAQMFDATGHEVGGELTVSTNNNPILQSPRIAALDSGHFVVIWTVLEDGVGGSSYDITAQLLDAAGNKLGGEFRANTDTAGGQVKGNVAALPTGGFVVTWEDSEGEGIEGQIFDAAGNKVGAELSIYASATEIGQPEVAALESGAFVVTWTEFVADGVIGIGGQIVGADGVDIGGPLLLAVALTTGATIEQYVAGLPGGGFVLSWNNATPNADDDEDYTDSWAQFFSATGAPVGDPFLIAQGDGNSQRTAHAALLGSGDVAFAWDYEFVENNAAITDISARILSRVDGGAQITGTPGGDVLHGTEGDDVIFGLGGDDEIDGDAGNDALDGGADDDVLHGGDGNDSLFELGGENDQLFGGDGDDRLIYHGISAGVLNALLDGGAGDDLLEARAIGANDFVTMTGGGGRDRIIFEGLGETITIDAGADGDLVRIETFLTDFEITLGAGVDLLVLSGSDPYPAGSVVITDFTPGDAGDALNLADYLIANVGPVTNPFAGGQLMLMQNGADALLYVDGDGQFGPVSMFDLVIVFQNVSVGSLTAHNLGGYAPNGSAVPGVSLSGSAGLDFFTGDSGNDLIAGNGGTDVLYGGGGNDRLEGGDGDDELSGQLGNDILIGGTGADTMTGGTGSDTFYVDNAGDVVNETASQGNDRVATSVSYALAAGAEVETLEAVNTADTSAMDLTANDFVNLIIGNAGMNLIFAYGGNDTLIGNGGNDFLIGGTGADLMYGGTGNDTFYVDDIGDRAYELAGEGTDRIATLISYTLDDASEVELLESTNTLDTNAMDLTGSNSANQIIGNAGVNLLYGLGGNDQLVGLAGNDFLVGGTGADLMYGGTGNDTFYVDDIGDRAYELAGEGTADRIATSISYTLDGASEVELLEAVNLTATDAMDLTGSDSGQTIIGNDGVNLLFGAGGNDTLIARAGNDFLIGGTGDDVMHGGTGNDTYYVDSANDQANELAGQGNDRVATSVSYTLSAEIETLEAVNGADTSAMNLTGNAIANTMVGNAGVNIIDGKGGSDVLTGLGGADTFAFTTALGAGNVDRIVDFVSGTDKIALDDAIFGALGAGAFAFGTAAQDADDRIVYDSATGNLYFDADGNGSGAQVLFATLDTHPVIVASDFIVI